MSIRIRIKNAESYSLLLSIVLHAFKQSIIINSNISQWEKRQCFWQIAKINSKENVGLPILYLITYIHTEIHRQIQAKKCQSQVIWIAKEKVKWKSFLFIATKFWWLCEYGYLCLSKGQKICVSYLTLQGLWTWMNLLVQVQINANKDIHYISCICKANKMKDCQTPVKFIRW